MRKNVTYTLKDSKVNGLTFFVSLFFRLIFAVLACVLFAVALPSVTFGQVLLVALGLVFIVLAREFTVTFSD